MSEFEKILVCAPTAAAKKYCFPAWLDHAMNLTYPNYVIRLFDNSVSPAFTNWMNELFKSKYGDSNKFKAYHTPFKSNSVVERMTHSTEYMRQYALKKNYKTILSLETDIFPELNVIEELYAQDKMVVGAVYDRDEGSYRKVCIQKIVKEAPDSLISMNFKSGEELGLIDGTLKAVSSVGLGCVLIRMKVLKELAFRFFSSEIHPDQFFSESMAMMNVKIYSLTSCVCERHESKEWGIVGIDYK